jgi:hypothetical protein
MAEHDPTPTSPRADPANWTLRCKWCERQFPPETLFEDVRAHARGAHQHENPEFVLLWVGEGPAPPPARLNGA